MHIENETNKQYFLLICSGMLVMSTLFLLFLFLKFKILVNNGWRGFLLFESLVLLLFLISIFSSLKALRGLRECYTIKWSVVTFLIEIITYILLLSIFVPAKLHFKFLPSPLVIFDCYILLWTISLTLFGLSIELPTKYNKKYIENQIGSFYKVFSKNTINFWKVITIIYADEMIKYFLRPWADIDDRKYHGLNIISNLRKLRITEISAYNKLRSKVKEKCEPQPFWNIAAIIVSAFGMIITLFKNVFFTTLKNVFSGADYNSFNFFVCCFFIDVFILLIVNAFSYARKANERKYYNEMYLFFVESEKI